MKPWIKKTTVGIAVALVAIQFIPVEQPNPESRDTPDGSSEAVALLQRACYECHSNETTWPWYTKVAPFSWLAAHDVEEGREHVNFSEWSNYTPEDQDHIREEVWEMLEEGEMPPWFYTPIHPEAKFTAEELARLKAWSGAGEEDDDD